MSRCVVVGRQVCCAASSTPVWVRFTQPFHPLRLYKISTKISLELNTHLVMLTTWTGNIQYSNWGPPSSKQRCAPYGLIVKGSYSYRFIYFFKKISEVIIFCFSWYSEIGSTTKIDIKDEWEKLYLWRSEIFKI